MFDLRNARRQKRRRLIIIMVIAAFFIFKGPQLIENMWKQFTSSTEVVTDTSQFSSENYRR